MAKESSPVQIASGNFIAQAGPGANAIINVYELIRPKLIDEQRLAVAEQLLAKLPLDYIPESSTLPFGSRMPLSHNPLFVGREEDLRTLASILKAGGIAAIGQTAVVTGLGGIGKTQLASEFVHRYGKYFDGGVFWLNFSDSQVIPSEVANCGGSGAPDFRPDYNTLPMEDQVRLVLSAWQSPLPRLLVFDNCEVDSLLNQWRPSSGACRVLVTSRRSNWDSAMDVQALSLRLLHRDESILLLHRHRSDLNELTSYAIAEELGDLPLALHLAGSFLARYKHTITPKDYLVQLRDQALLNHPSLMGKGSTFSPTGHELNVARTFAISYNKLDPKEATDALALMLLARAAYFAPSEPISRPLLTATLSLPKNDPNELLLVEDAVIRLTEMGLLETEAEGALSLHRLLQVFLRQIDSDSNAQESVENTFTKISCFLSKIGNPKAIFSFPQHLKFVTNMAKEREDERASKLCNAFAYYLMSFGDYAGAQSYLERALAICEETLGEKNQCMVISLNNMGYFLQETGNVAGARPYYERALSLCSEERSDVHSDFFANCLNNMGYMFAALKDFDKAHNYFKQSLEIRLKELKDDDNSDLPTGLINCLGNIGTILLEQNYLDEANLYLEKALQICGESLSEDNLYTAICLHNYGTLLFMKEDIPGAWAYFSRALSINEKLFGDHPDTAKILISCADILHKTGDTRKALLTYERALSIFEKTLGKEHPLTIQSSEKVGLCLEGLCYFNKSKPYLERVVASRVKLMGEKCPDTISSLTDQGCLLRSRGELAKARPYFEQALEISEKEFGDEHPLTAIALNNLGSLLFDLKNLVGARPLFEKALAIREKVIGKDHPYTLSSIWWMGNLLTESGDKKGAISYFKRAIVVSTRNNGASHPQTIEFRKILKKIKRSMRN